MALTKKQKELDEQKWLKSEELGQDACGTFDYCAACDKSLENPCDHAYRKTHARPKSKKPAESGEKKPAARRSCAKKPAGAKPGFVIYHTNYSMVAEPNIVGIKEEQ